MFLRIHFRLKLESSQERKNKGNIVVKTGGQGTSIDSVQLFGGQTFRLCRYISCYTISVSLRQRIIRPRRIQGDQLRVKKRRKNKTKQNKNRFCVTLFTLSFGGMTGNDLGEIWVTKSQAKLTASVETPQWGTADAEKTHLLRTQSSKVLPFKPEAGPYTAMHATPTGRDFLFANFYPSGAFTCIFSKSSSDFFLCWLWLTPVPVWAHRIK